jgi:hypothetical protein
MLSLKGAEWSLNTLLSLLYGFQDHAESVRLCALEALMDIASGSPEPITISPVSLLSYVIYSFTVSSGATPLIFNFLVQLDTPEADEAIKELLAESTDIRNEDFREFVTAVVDANKSDLLKVLEDMELGQKKSKLLRQALNGNRSEVEDYG